MDRLRRNASAAVLAVLALVPGACGGDPAGPGPAAGSPSPSVASLPPCPGGRWPPAGGGRAGESVAGDVDGDGTDDEVTISLLTSNPPGCQAFVAVATASGTSAAPIRAWSRQVGLATPRVAALADLDGRAGEEVIVDVAAGASTRFAGVFASRDGVIRRVEIEGDQVFEDLWPYGGSVGHLDGVDCGPDGIVATSAVPSSKGRDHYDITRRFYSLRGASFVPGREKSFVMTLAKAGERFPELLGAPFGTCPPGHGGS